MFKTEHFLKWYCKYEKLIDVVYISVSWLSLHPVVRNASGHMRVFLLFIWYFLFSFIPYCFEGIFFTQTAKDLGLVNKEQ